MKLLFTSVMLMLMCGMASAKDYVPADYTWTTQSQNSSESMPCGGHDVGMNVWVEDGDLLFYLSKSGLFDENNTLLKAGRIRLHIDGNPFASNFSQTLRLDDGAIYIKGAGTSIRLWADVFSPVVFLEINGTKKSNVTLSYESWRYRNRLITKGEQQQCSWKWLLPKETYTFADSIIPSKQSLQFYHQNRKETVFDYTVDYEHLTEIKSQLYNPIGGLRWGATIHCPGLTFTGCNDGKYIDTDYRSWNYSGNVKTSVVSVIFEDGETNLNAKVSAKRSAQWWHDFWQRSWIQTDNDEAKSMIRNYELFRYMLGCNAYGQWPSKFNGSLFTFDPVFVDAAKPFSPDFRNWGGGTMTAQNQRLVYWPMLKSGDIDMMKSQFDTYLRMLPNAVARTRYNWGHDGASFTEQMENFGLPNPAEFGKHKDTTDYGTERNAWLEYLWDTSLEFCQMILLAHSYGNLDIAPYEELISQCVKFFDLHYQYLAKQRGAKALNGQGKLTIFPGSGAETYKMAYNPSSTIAALQTVLQTWGKDSAMLGRIPDIPLHVINGDTCIAPAVAWDRINNEETPQLYPVFPWRIYGLGRQHIDIARNTYLKDSHAIAMRSSKGWKQDNIWAACLGLEDEAVRLNLEKWSNGPFRFPVFFDKGFDWTPDVNKGGAAMIGLQEMLLQETPEGELLLFPCWPKKWNCKFRLHATDDRIIEAEIKDGQIVK
ncbi:MAG: DUF5703 domain-containing protein [Prevotellaceae bacterium]|nr:DUF5703 domain-containing protein [Prevotellaceae bacterium]